MVFADGIYRNYPQTIHSIRQLDDYIYMHQITVQRLKWNILARTTQEEQYQQTFMVTVATAFTLSNNASTNDVFVFYNGVAMKPTTDYGISGATLTFTFTPVNNSQIMARYFV